MKKSAFAIVMALAAGCATDDPATNQDVWAEGNQELGIVRFSVEETGIQSSVVGFDSSGKEVARVGVVHGRFEVSERFREDYPGMPEIDGRKLDVFIKGKLRLNWETMGYEPVMHMPAHPRGEFAVGALLEDPHVKPLLDRWQIGFEPSSTSYDEEAYVGGELQGVYSYNCSTLDATSYECGTARGGLDINECGGTAAAIMSVRTTRTTAAGYAYDEHLISQCCPSGSGGQTSNWYGLKSCPTTGSSGSTANGTCGTAAANAACKGCAGYPSPYDGSHCFVTPWNDNTYSSYSYANSAEVAACFAQYNGTTNLIWQYSDPCFSVCSSQYIDLGGWGFYYTTCA